MSPRKSENKNTELSKLIYQWRSKKFKTAKAFFESAKFDYSYTTYTDYERGALVPDIDHFLMIAEALEIDPFKASLIWVTSQMPRPELKKRYQDWLNLVEQGDVSPRELKTEAEAHVQVQENQSPNPDNTWILGPKDREALLKNPWLANILFALTVRFPEAVSLEDLSIPNMEALDHFFDSGMLLREEDKIKAKLPYFYIPRTPEWTEVRNNNSMLALQDLLTESTIERQQTGRAYRELTIRSLSVEQSVAVVPKLKQVADYFRSLPHSEESGDDAYGLLVVFGKRNLLKTNTR